MISLAQKDGPPPLALREARAEDARLLFGWRNIPAIVALSSQKKVVDWPEHEAWFDRTLAAPELGLILIARSGVDDVGLVRFDRPSADAARISAYLIPEFTGTGLGPRAIALGVEAALAKWPRLKVVEALVLRENARGQQAFRNAGFVPAAELDDAKHLGFHVRLPLTSATPADLRQWSGEAHETIARYHGQFAQHGVDVHSLGWGSERSQYLRFSVLAEILDLTAARILDVGCGFGDFFGFLSARGFRGHYTGIDLAPDLISAARTRYPAATFEAGDIHSLPPDPAFDVVVASGIFTYCRHAPYRQFSHTLGAMVGRARLGVAVNSLSTWGDEPVDGECQLSPTRAVEIAHGLCPNVVLRHDYAPHDFTIYLRKTA